MRHEILALTGHPRFPSRRWIFRTLGAQVEATWAVHFEREVTSHAMQEMNRLQSDMLFIDGMSLYLCALPVLDAQHFLNCIRSRLGFPAVRY